MLLLAILWVGISTQALACGGKFPEIANMLFEWEGARTDDPDDPGGPTTWGITRRGLNSHHLNFIALSDIDYDMACELYRIFWMIKPNIDDLPIEYRAHIFDWEVLHGDDGRRELQRILKQLGYYWGPIHGILDGRTITAAFKSVHDGKSNEINNMLVQRRINKVTRLAQNPRLHKFLPGWKRRALRFAR